MSENLKNQDEVELKCLEFIKKNLDEDDCFGLSHKQYIEMKKWLKSAQLSLQSSKFPDIEIKDGFIEHFAVTSSQEDKKGSKQIRELRNFQKNSEANFISNLNEGSPGDLVSISATRNFEEHSYINLIKSIKKNWIKHIESYEKCSDSFSHRIFLLEYIDVNIQTAVSKKNKAAEIFKSYKISTDNFLLEWIYRYVDKVDYLFLVNQQTSSIELINLSMIPEMLERDIESRHESVIGFMAHKYQGIKCLK